MVQVNELINLLLTLSGTLLFFAFSRGYQLPPFRWFYTGFFMVLLSDLFTVLEGLLWFDLFNILEHGSMLLAGLFFLAEIVRMSRQGDLP